MYVIFCLFKGPAIKSKTQNCTPIKKLKTKHYSLGTINGKLYIFVIEIILIMLIIFYTVYHMLNLFYSRIH